MNEMMIENSPLMVRALRREHVVRPPVWLMRQAGRYLPEYRELRAQAGGFLEMVYHPQRAAEITMQPVRRFGMDGAILFSDILVIPHALGQGVRFEAGAGPRLDPLKDPGDLHENGSEAVEIILAPIYETVRRVRDALSAEGFDQTALIGFCGGPWTVACYMIEGGGSSDFAAARTLATEDVDMMDRLFDRLIAVSIEYLCGQAQAGAQVLQIFESWAGLLAGDDFDRWVIAPTQKIIAGVRARYPNIPIIGFPRGVSKTLLARYVRETGVNGLGCDYTHDPADLRDLQEEVCLQGNLDPALLLEGGIAMEKAASHILESWTEGAFIFNLGHGVIKETDPDQVNKLVKLVQEYRI